MSSIPKLKQYDVGVGFSCLVGKTMKDVWSFKDQITFETTDGEFYRACHDQNSSEQVTLEDIEGDLTDLIGSPILISEEVTNKEDLLHKRTYLNSFTWTFYKLATIKGYVTLRWFGESDGHYSESITLKKLGWESVKYTIDLDYEFEPDYDE